MARFAQATLARLLLVECGTVVVSGASIACGLFLAWAPVLSLALTQLPRDVRLDHGQLAWPGQPLTTLGRNHFLAIVIDLENASQGGQLADVQVEFGRAAVKLRSLLGYWALPYPAEGTLDVDRIRWESAWGAWRPFILLAAGAASAASLVLIWAILAAGYSVPLHILAWVLRREISHWGCWKLASAALLPGALGLSVAILLYGLGQLELVGLLFVFLLHFLAGWFYLLLAPTCLPRRSPAPKTPANPFAAPNDQSN